MDHLAVYAAQVDGQTREIAIRLQFRRVASPPARNTPEAKDTWSSGGKVRESAYSRAPDPRLSCERLFPEGGESQCELQRPGGAEPAGPVAAGPHSRHLPGWLWRPPVSLHFPCGWRPTRPRPLPCPRPTIPP